MGVTHAHTHTRPCSGIADTFHYVADEVVKLLQPVLREEGLVKDSSFLEAGLTAVLDPLAAPLMSVIVDQTHRCVPECRGRRSVPWPGRGWLLPLP